MTKEAMTNETKEKMATKAKEAIKRAILGPVDRILWTVTIIFLGIVAIIAVHEWVTNPTIFVDSPEEYAATSEDYYLTFKVHGKKVQGEMTIIAENDEKYIVQMGDKVYTVPQSSVVFE